MEKAKKVPEIMAEYPRTMYIDLDAADLKLLDSAEVGKKIQIVVSGKVCGVNQRERKYDGKAEKSGTLDIESPKVRLLKVNEFSDLAEDD
jgi:hypothetical protein